MSPFDSKSILYYWLIPNTADALFRYFRVCRHSISMPTRVLKSRPSLLTELSVVGQIQRRGLQTDPLCSPDVLREPTVRWSKHPTQTEPKPILLDWTRSIHQKFLHHWKTEGHRRIDIDTHYSSPAARSYLWSRASSPRALTLNIDKTD
jgi:hypothetical protein